MFKILVCSNPDWAGEKIVERYEMRWTAIEIFIRELRQELGFEDYSGQSLQAMERYLDLVLMSFLYLELRRFGVVNDSASTTAEREQASSARTRGFQDLVKHETDRLPVDAIRKSYASPRQRRIVMAFFEATSQQAGYANP